MRIDLAHDFQKLLNTYFLEFIKNMNQKYREYEAPLSMDFIHYKSEYIFRSALYYCCKNCYYTLDIEIFNRVSNKECIMFKRHYQEWEPCVDIHNKAFVRELSKRYHYQERNTIRVVDHYFLQYEKLQFYIGICIDLEDGHQVFYMWDYTVSILKLNMNKMALLEIEKLKYLTLHRDFLKFSKKQKKEGEASTVEDFYTINFINRKTFQKKHKEIMKTTFYDYHLQMRSLDILKIIITTSEPIKLIPSKVGISDYSVLSKVFKKKQFLSPSKYRDSFL